jgi:hypothetical protein
MNNKQGTEKERAAEGAWCPEHKGEGERGKELLSTRTSVNKDWKGDGPTVGG